MTKVAFGRIVLYLGSPVCRKGIPVWQIGNPVTSRYPSFAFR